MSRTADAGAVGGGGGAAELLHSDADEGPEEGTEGRDKLGAHCGAL